MKTTADGSMMLTLEQAKEMTARGETRTDQARVAATTDADLERQAHGDSDVVHPPENWEATARAGFPWPISENKQQVTLRLDPEILSYFKDSGRGWQTRVNAVLRSYVETHR